MTPCQRTDISERLMMALLPEEFPESMPQIEEHLEQCSTCRQELEVLRQLETAFKEQKDQLADAFSPCPDPEVLFDFATDQSVSPSIEKHIALCSDCARHVALVKELLLEDLKPDDVPIPLPVRELVHDMVRREYGHPRESFLQPVRDFLASLNAFVHFPSLAAGAAVAGLLLLLLVPLRPGEVGLNPALSDVIWKAAPPISAKNLTGPEASLISKKKVALLVLLPQDLKLPQEEVGRIYGEVDMATRLAGQYQFFSPKEIKRDLESAGSFKNARAIAKFAAGRTGANYILTFEIMRSDSTYSLKGTIFRAGHESAVGSILQTNLRLSAIPARITGIGTELILEAEST